MAEVQSSELYFNVQALVHGKIVRINGLSQNGYGCDDDDADDGDDVGHGDDGEDPIISMGLQVYNFPTFQFPTFSILQISKFQFSVFQFSFFQLSNFPIFSFWI